jgi:hypothetical protein
MMPRSKLSFLLPATLVLRAMPGRHAPCLAGCLVEVGHGGLVEVIGPDREAVFEQAARFLRVVMRGTSLPARTIAAQVATQGELGAEPGAPARRDGWQIVIGAEIAFVAGGIEPRLFPLRAPRPQAQPAGGPAQERMYWGGRGKARPPKRPAKRPA